MIEKRIIEQVVEDQKHELVLLAQEKFCNRMEESLLDLDSNRAQVVVGVRRSGKSVLCFKVLHENKKPFAYINFDDDRLVGLEASELNNVLEALYINYGDFKYLFMDEVQNVDGWHLFVNRLLRQRIHVVITGSNAKLLSGDLATHLTGRNARIELLPFSFSKFCQHKQVDTTSHTTKAVAFRRATHDEYLKDGGFPELFVEKNKKQYIIDIVDDIINKDLVRRFKIKNVNTFVRLTHHLLNVAPTIVVAKQLGQLFEMSHVTVSNYIDYLKQAYLLVGVQCYSTKSRMRMRNEKIYPIDVALLNGRQNAFASENLGWRLETQVFQELYRRNRPRGRDIFYYRHSNGVEADFVVCQDNRVMEVYQVSYDISNPKTYSREKRGLLTASAATGCDKLFLITDNVERHETINGKTIHIIPAHEWMINKD